jgi:transposase-like protein
LENTALAFPVRYGATVQQTANDDALIKLYYLALRNISKNWTKSIQNWKAVFNRFTIMFYGRMPQY